MKIIKVSSSENDLQSSISEIFVEGFYQWLKFFSKDKIKLAHAFNADVFYVAVENDETLGFAACTIQLNQRELRQYLGFIMGTVAHRVLKNEFEDKPYPFEITQDMGTIEFVATSSKHRGKGVATQIIQHIHAHTPFKKYVLEVADTNINAIRLYKKLGYQVFKRVPEPHSKQSGFNYYLYMQFVKNNV